MSRRYYSLLGVLLLAIAVSALEVPFSVVEVEIIPDEYILLEVGVINNASTPMEVMYNVEHTTCDGLIYNTTTYFMTVPPKQTLYSDDLQVKFSKQSTLDDCAVMVNINNVALTTFELRKTESVSFGETCITIPKIDMDVCLHHVFYLSLFVLFLSIMINIARRKWF